MGIIVLFLIAIVGMVLLTYLIVSKQKESEITSLKDEIAALVRDSDVVIKENKELKEDKEKLQDDLSSARDEIWDYETSEKTPVQKTRIDDMKSYIFHLLHKQNAVLGLNENDKEWIRKLGGQLPRGE